VTPELTPLRRNRDFVLLQTGQLLSTFGSNVSRIAYPLLALAVTHSPAKAGYVGAVQFAPLLLFGLAAGIVADRVDRRRLMIASDAVSALAVASLAAVALAHETRFWVILAVAFVDGAAGTFYRAGQRGAFRAVVPRAQLAEAASVTQARGAMVLLGAPPVGGALFAIGRGVPFLADAISYAFSTASALLIRARFQEERDRDPASAWRQLAEGISFYARIPFLRTTMTLIAISNFTTSGVQLAVIVLARRDGLSSTVVGGFVALVGATALLGSLASPLVRRVVPIHAIILSEFWAALGYLAFLAWPSVYVLATAFAVQAFCFPNTDAAIAAYNFALIPDRLLGRALSVSDTLRVLAVPLGPLAAGLLLDNVSARWTIGVLMGVTLAVTLPATLSRSIRETPALDELLATT
jgi:MFS family permease